MGINNIDRYINEIFIKYKYKKLNIMNKRNLITAVVVASAVTTGILTISNTYSNANDAKNKNVCIQSVNGCDSKDKDKKAEQPIPNAPLPINPGHNPFNPKEPNPIREGNRSGDNLEKMPKVVNDVDPPKKETKKPSKKPTPTITETKTVIKEEHKTITHHRDAVSYAKVNGGVLPKTGNSTLYAGFIALISALSLKSIVRRINR